MMKTKGLLGNVLRQEEHLRVLLAKEEVEITSEEYWGWLDAILNLADKETITLYKVKGMIDCNKRIQAETYNNMLVDELQEAEEYLVALRDKLITYSVIGIMNNGEEK